MSQLIDKLNRLGRVAPQPMGFRSSQAGAAGPRVLLIAALPPTGADANPADCAAGADAVLVNLPKTGPAAKAPPETAAALPDTPWGCRLSDARKAEAMSKAGCDFVVLTAASPAAATPQDDNTGIVLEVDASLGDGLLRAVSGLPVDVVLAADAIKAGETATWQHLMLCRRLASFTGKPLLLSVPPTLTGEEIKTLWEAGVDALVVDAAKPGALKGLRETVDKIKFPASRKRSRAEAIIPRVVGGEPSPPPEEDDDGDDD